jgi:tetratricopeptide (TPR) repeat protein
MAQLGHAAQLFAACRVTVSRFLAALACAGLLLAQRAPVEAAWDLLAKGERKQAISALHEILKTNPGDADARLLLGSILAEDGERSESIAQLSEGVRLRPQSAEARNALGEAFKGFGEMKMARGAFEEAVALDPAFAQARENLGQALVQAGEFGAAAKHLDRALQILGHTPDAAYPHYLRAKVNTEQNDIQQAAAHLNEAVSLRPDFAEAWSDLGQARKTLLDNAGALAAFRRAVDAGPDDAVAQYRLGSEYLHQGQPHLAILHLQKASALNPDDQSTLYSLQTALRRDGQVEQATKTKEKLTELLRKRDKAVENALTGVQLNNQGAEFEKAGNLRGALEKYRAAVELCPEHVGFRVNFAVALLRLGQWGPGIAELRKAARQDPGNSTVKAALDDALAQAPPKPQP